jgi:hypothetical protein
MENNNSGAPPLDPQEVLNVRIGIFYIFEDSSHQNCEAFNMARVPAATQWQNIFRIFFDR